MWLFKLILGSIIIACYRLGEVMCMGVTAGAYILTLFAVSCNSWCSFASKLSQISVYFKLIVLLLPFCLQMKYKQRVLGLILISPLCRAPTWTEWLYNKVPLSSLDYQLLKGKNLCLIKLCVPCRWCQICFTSMACAVLWKRCYSSGISAR